MRRIVSPRKHPSPATSPSDSGGGPLTFVCLKDGDEQFLDQRQVSRLVVQINVPVAAPDLPEEAGGHLGQIRRQPREVELKQGGGRPAEKELHFGGYGVAAEDLQPGFGVFRAAHDGGPI